ncbi:MAG TPA: DUF6526 family protein [Planctomycetota bacterium]|nr:DUF6526 family protein [Planctomycetota bacterium]
METVKPQDFKHHARFVPLFHFFTLPVLLVNVIWRLVELRNGLAFSSVFGVVLAVALLFLGLYARTFVLSVQDRIIRLEMTLRLEKLLPADLRSRIDEITPDQLIGLRFAGDDELAGLAKQALDERGLSRKTIKSRVKNWKPDYMRA